VWYLVMHWDNFTFTFNTVSKVVTTNWIPKIFDIIFLSLTNN